jgi:hypothetical protein
MHTAFNMASYCVEMDTNGLSKVRFEFQNEAHCVSGRHTEHGPSKCDTCRWKSTSAFQSSTSFRDRVENLERDMPRDDQMGLWLVKMVAGTQVTPSARTEWENSIGGHSFAHYVYAKDGNQYHTVYAPKSAVKHMKALGAVEDVIALPPELKLSAELIEVLEANVTKPYVGLNIMLAEHKEATKQNAQQIAKNWQSMLQSVDAHLVVTAHNADSVSIKNIQGDMLREVVGLLAADPLVLWIEPLLDFVALNAYARGITQAANVDKKPIWDAGLHGENLVIGVGDSGLDYMSNYFYDPDVAVSVAIGGTFTSDKHRKISQYVAYADNKAGTAKDHGSHVQGSIAGEALAGSSAPTAYNGMAYKARLAFFDIGKTGASYLDVPPSIYSDLFPPSYSRGARLHSNSWGAASNTYNLNARDVDKYMWEHQDFLVLHAAGNSGDSGSSTIGTPATSKNGVCVGATQNSISSESDGNCAESGSPQPCEENMASFSSRGPMFDNRIAPTVSAPGYYITSVASQAAPTKPHSDITKMAGTSMATPITTGNAALIQQYLQEGYYPSGVKTPGNAITPMGSLIKAMLVNCAKYMKGKVGTSDLSSEPSNSQGFGRIELDKSLAFSSSGFSLFLVGDYKDQKKLSTGQVHTYKFDVTSTTRSLKLTLVYTDYPAATSASTALVNDLDLLVTAPGGQKYYPNGLTAKDTLNNIEQIEIKTSSTPALAAGSYTVTVTGTRVSNGPQPYALVVTGAFAKTAELYPIAGPIITSASPVILSSATTVTVDGTGFSAAVASNMVTLTCTGAAPTATVKTATLTRLVLTVDVADCDDGPLKATVQVGSFASAATQVAVISNPPPSNPCDGVVCKATQQCQADGTCQVDSAGKAKCVYPNAADGKTCDDANPDTSGDVCTAGVCRGQSLCAGVGTCVAMDQCHDAGVCSGGLCSNPVKKDGTACNDGYATTINDVCTAGVCKGQPAQPGPPIGKIAWIQLSVAKKVDLTTAEQQEAFVTAVATIIGFDPAYMSIAFIDTSDSEHNTVVLLIQDNDATGTSAVEAVDALASTDKDGMSELGVDEVSTYEPTPEPDSSNSSSGASVGMILIIMACLIFVLGLAGGAAVYCVCKKRRNKMLLNGTSSAMSPVSIPMAMSPASGQISSPTSSAPFIASSPPRSAPRVNILQESLPKGWKEMKSSVGETYYWHEDTGTSQWSRP